MELFAFLAEKKHRESLPIHLFTLLTARSDLGSRAFEVPADMAREAGWRG
jgi:hypothetical protein